MATKNDFLNILRSLENEVLALVASLEQGLGKVASVPSASAPSSDSSTTKKPYAPFWKGLRGVGRWLWKGYSKDNPDYAHLYNDEPKKECWSPLTRGARPSLHDYLEFVRTLDSFADEILLEAFGKLVFEESSPSQFASLMNNFRSEFRNIIKKYIDIINKIPEGSSTEPSKKEPEVAVRTAPEETEADSERATGSDKVAAPEETEADSERATGSDKVDSDTIDKKSTSTEPEIKIPSVVKSSNKDTEVRSPETSTEKPKEQEPNKQQQSQDVEKKKPANYKKWVEEAITAKKNGSIGQPNETWLTKTGYISREKLPWVVAWMSMKSHKDITSDEEVEKALRSDSALGAKFRGLSNKNKDGKNTLIKNLRAWFPLAGEDEFKKMLSDLGVDESIELSTAVPGEEKQTKKSSKKDKEQEEKETSSSSEEISSEEPTEWSRIVSKLYDGKDKEETVKAIQEILIRPLGNRLESDSDKRHFGTWWKNLKNHIKSNKEETIESLIKRISTGSLFDDIIDNIEASKNKPDKTVDKNTLLDLVKSAH